jgi:hypothetical protein
MHGMWHLEKGRARDGERHLRLAIALFPYDATPYVDLAERYRESGLCAPARDLYRQALALGVSRPRARFGLVSCLLRDAEFGEAGAEARRGVSQGGDAAHVFRRLAAIADSAAGAATAPDRDASHIPIRPSGAPRRAPER